MQKQSMYRGRRSNDTSPVRIMPSLQQMQGRNSGTQQHSMEKANLQQSARWTLWLETQNKFTYILIMFTIDQIHSD